MSIFLHELRFYRRNTAIWTASLCAGTALLFSMFPAFAGNTQALEDVLRNYPDVVQKAFGLSPETIGTVPGFYSFIVTFLMLCGAVQAISLGISVLSKEIAGKTADFLLTRPLTRGRVLTAKLLAVLCCVAATSAVSIGATFAMAFSVKDAAFDLGPFVLMALSFFWVQLIFLALGFLIGAAAPKIRSVLPISLSTVFGLFIVGMVAAALDQKDLYYLSPFKYFDTVGILQTSAYQTSFVVTAAAVTALAVCAGYAVYGRRDIQAA
ncbi:MAG: ABC transporter permease subunit [Clostridiales bacterium]|nr:ABC transporter permease subunit [Clostridiales bacterium]